MRGLLAATGRVLLPLPPLRSTQTTSGLTESGSDVADSELFAGPPLLADLTAIFGIPSADQNSGEPASGEHPMEGLSAAEAAPPQPGALAAAGACPVGNAVSLMEPAASAEPEN